MDAKTAQSLFAGAIQNKTRSSKEESTVNFRGSNDSLVKKNILYKQQLAQCAKTIEKLRNENLALRQRNQELIDEDLDRKIELIVEQRVQNRLAHAAVLNRKLVQILQQTGAELTNVFADIETEPTGLVTRRAPKTEINLERVNETPLCRVTQKDRYEGIENLEETSSRTQSTSLLLENGTPRKKNIGSKGRRSEMFQNLNSGDVSISEEVTAAAPVSRRAPILIAPTATPGGPPKKTAPSSSSRKFKKPTTPAPAPIESTPVTDTVQVRRQRSAKLNIKTLKEPSLGGKLRRPGKHDEPMPYIDTFF